MQVNFEMCLVDYAILRHEIQIKAKSPAYWIAVTFYSMFGTPLGNTGFTTIKYTCRPMTIFSDGTSIIVWSVPVSLKDRRSHLVH